MSITQLASMFIGSSDLTDEDVGKLKGVSSTIGNIIHITDGKNDNILSVITAKNIIHNLHHKSLKDNYEIFDFECIGEQNYDEYLKKGNRLIVPGEYEGELIEFVIDDVDDRRSSYKKFEIKSYGSYLDLQKAKVIEPFSRTATAREHIIHALVDTEHTVGIVESDRTITISFENYTNPFEYLRRIANEFDLELNFRIEHNGLRVTNRPIDALDRIGAWRGREITFGKDLEEINRLESGDIYTALIGLGPEREDGSRLQVLVEDNDALKRWGRPEGNPQHLIGVYEPQSEREDMTTSELRQYTKTELDKRKNSVINYEINFLDLEHILGHENKKIRFGDTIRVKDTYFEPNLYVEARIFEMRRNVIVPAQKEYVLGDFIEYDAETIHSIYDILKRQLAKKAGIQQLLNYAEPKKIESNTPPTIKSGENPIWVDTSKTPKVAHVVVAGQWQKMTPTTPAEVNAYTKQQVDQKAQQEAEAKAAQALADAKAFSRNASNITEGVIDVGAIPLRTSITGARLEWDGVNGLVQYNVLGEPVSWLDLDANAHFANAFLSGRVEANEGYFGDNIRLRDGKVEIIRPDGAVSSQDGMIAGGEPLNPYDPHYMRMGVSNAGTANDTFRAFSSELDSWYSSTKGRLDGRGVTGWHIEYEDVRDSMGAVVFNRYTFTHKSRYMVFKFHKAENTGKFSIHIVKGASANTSDRVYFEILEASTSGVLTFVTDLGKPTFEQKDFSFKIGWTNSWGGRDETIRFRMISAYQTDFI